MEHVVEKGVAQDVEFVQIAIPKNAVLAVQKEKNEISVVGTFRGGSRFKSGWHLSRAVGTFRGHDPGHKPSPVTQTRPRRP